MHQESVVQSGTTSHTVERLLELHARDAAIPDGCATSFSAFTNQNIAVFQPVALFLVLLKPHCPDIGEVQIEPADIRIPKVGLKVSPVLLCIEHFSEAQLSHIAQGGNRPHSRFAEGCVHLSIPSSPFTPRWISSSSFAKR